MKVAIVSARPPEGDDPRSRHASAVAAGLRRAGLDVEHMAADHAVAPRLWETVRHRARAYDVVHVVGIRALPAVFAAHGRARGIVVSPQDDQGPVSMLRRLLNRPSGPASRALLEMADRIVCSTAAETQRLAGVVPAASDRMRVVPLGVDTAAIRGAQPLPGGAEVVLALSGPGRGHRIARSVAALADLGPAYELAVAGPCSPAASLQAEARQLGVADRVRFLGRVDDGTLHRWLRTARVVVALSDRFTSPALVLAALAAGTPVVLSDVAPHLDAVTAGDVGVTFLPGDASPLALADAISAAARVRLSPAAAPGLPTVDDEISGLLAVYGELVDLPARRSAGAPRRAAATAGRRAS